MVFLSEQQKELTDRYENNRYKCIVSNDYDLLIKEIKDYMHDVSIKCKYCRRKFIPQQITNTSCKIFPQNKMKYNLLYT